MSSDKPTRAHEHELTIDAPPDVVWKAITDPQSLVRWFALKAVVEPGPGGRIVYSWPPDFEGPCDIDRWEPPLRLRTSWPFLPPAIAEADRRRVAVDWILEGRGGATVLRVVHSGFGFGSDWDDEYDGSDRGWSYELQSLKHYLERHRGHDRRMIWLRRAARMDADAGWNRLLGPDGFGREGSLRGARPGDRVAVTAATGDRLEGTVVHSSSGRAMAFTLRALDDGLLRLGYETTAVQPEASVIVSAWGPAAADADAFAARARGLLERLFPPGM